MKRSLFLVLPFLLLGQIILDDVMSPEEQKKTGINRLSYKEKEELEAWLNKNFMPKQKQQVQPTTLTLSININDGHQLLLSDGTSWEIDPQDYSVSKDWLAPIPIVIKASNNQQYPRYLVNKTTGIKVRAKQMPCQKVKA